MLLTALIGLVGAALACTPATLSAALDEATAAYLRGDVGGLRAAEQRARESLACLEVPLEPDLVRRLYVVRSLDALARQPRDEDQIRALLVGMLAQDPELTFDPQLARPGSLLPMLLEEVRQQPAPPPPAPLTLPEGCCAWLDGQRAAARPAGRPTLLQLSTEDGEVVYTGWLWPGQPLPTELCPSPPPPERAVVLVPIEPLTPPPGQRLLQAGGAGLAVSGGLALGAILTGQRYASLDERYAGSTEPVGTLADEELRLRRQGNALGASAVVGGAVSLGVLSAGVVLRW